MNAPHAVLWWILTGIIAGWLTGRVMRGMGRSILADLVLGIIGALLGGWIFTALGITANSLSGGIVVAFIGAVMVVAIFRGLIERNIL